MNALQFEAPKGQRIYRYGLGCTTYTGDLWWDYATSKWAPLDTPHLDGASNTAPGCRTLKAFKRHLRKHAKELSGVEVQWVNRFQGHCVSVIMPEVE